MEYKFVKASKKRRISAVRTVKGNANSILRTYAKPRGSVEYKAFAATANGTASAGGTVIHLTAIAQGDTANDRDGNKCCLRTLNFRFDLTSNTNDAARSITRLILFRDNFYDPAFANPAVLDVLNTADHLSPFRHSTRNRFTILHDQYYCQRKDTELEQVAYKVLRRLTVKGKGIQCNFTGANRLEGHLYCLIIDNAPTYHPLYDLYWNVVFSDK